MNEGDIVGIDARMHIYDTSLGRRSLPLVG